MATLTGGEFVGRQQEMGKLKGVLEDALSGQGQVLMLVGEPGIGKTRTAQELAAYAETRGAQVLWGWCYEEEGAPPFWPWLQPIRAYVQQRDPEQLQSEMGPGAADIAEVVSEVRGKLPSLEPPIALQPEQARFRLFDSITTFLKNAAQSQPLMLVLDDLHWADKPSLLLLQFLVRQLTESHLLVVGCYRDLELSRQHPLSEALAQLSHLPVFQRELLLGMSQEDTGQFIELTARMRPSPQLVETIYARTEGNPFFLKEMTRLLSERGELGATGIGGPEGIRIPQGVREVIGQRLNRLSESCHQVLTIASVIGRELEFRLLSLVSSGVSEEQLLAVMDEALAAHLVEELPGGRERYRFSHALIQQTLAEELSTSRKVRWHARIGKALEELYGADVEVHAAELVYHFAKAESVLGTEKLVRYSLLAGERALAAYAWEEAREYFQRGLEAKGVPPNGVEVARDAEEAALLFGMGRAQSAILQEDQLLETFAIMKRAFGYYAEAGNIAMAVAIAEFPINPTGRFPGNAELMVRALALVPSDSYEAGRLLSRYGGILGLVQCDYEGAQQALGRALAIARREGDLALEVQTLTYASDVSGQHLQWQESVNYGLRSIAQSAGHENSYSAVLSRWWTSVSLLNMGDLQRARTHALDLRDLAEKQSTPRYYSMLGLVPIVTLSCLEGNWTAGREYCNHILKGAPTHRQILCARILLEYETGEFDQGTLYLERLLEEMRRGLIRFGLGKAPMTLIAVARITDMVDHLDMAKTTAEALLSEASTTPIVAMYAKAGLALLAAHTDNQAEAAEHYTYFREHRGTMIWTLTSVDRLLGLLSRTIGNLNLASDHFEDALAFCRKAGYRPELAWSCHDYAEALLQSSSTSDLAKALSLLEESLAIATDLGMRPLMERVVAMQERVHTQPAKAPAYPDGLTEREVEVLRLVASGKSNAEIAAELVLSIRTVERHISNIYAKINAHGRVDATSYAFTHGLISST